MRTFTILALAALNCGLAAQSNTVPGLDGRLTVINNMTYYGRRGASYPNGEIGMAMLNTMCNPGSVNIPWYAPMQPNHPMFGFIVARVANDRIEQINEWSYCKHAFLSVNVNGACGTCQNPGTGSLMGLNCADTYGAGNNASRTYLGPPQEIDPWLGEWDPVGSYFDIGDPAQSGYPEAADGSRSLNTAIFDSVDNRVTIDEIDLTTPGASYYYGLQLIHRGEDVANRDDNLAHRGMNPTWNGSTWSFPNNSGAPQEYGSILNRWPGATVNRAGNGTDDGRFYVASKVTSLGGGQYHYEYAVHNFDNSRAGGAFRVPVPAGVTVSNLSFGDIDTNGANDWSGAVTSTEVVWTATASNALEWNTIYNFGFDADIASGSGSVRLDEARPGPGAAFVDVDANVPGGLILANFQTYGAGCEGSTSDGTLPCIELNGNGGTLSNSTNQYEYCYRVVNGGTIDVTSFEVFTGTTGGSITRDAHIYEDVGGAPSGTPLATTSITVDAAAGFYTATFASPVTVTGNFYVGYENSPNGYVSNLTSGAGGNGFYRTAVTGNWSPSGLANTPSYRVHCTTGQQTYKIPALSNQGLPQLGATYDVTLDEALAVTFAALATGFSDQVYSGLPLPLTLPGTGCDLLMSADLLDLALTDGSGAASLSLTMPASASFVGTELYHQWVVFDPANALGLVLSNGGISLVGN